MELLIDFYSSAVDYDVVVSFNGDTILFEFIYNNFFVYNEEEKGKRKALTMEQLFHLITWMSDTGYDSEKISCLSRKYLDREIVYFEARWL